MAAYPYMPFYVAEHLDETAHLSPMAQGVYVALILCYWQREKPLPIEDKKLARMARASEHEWDIVKDDVLAFFETRDGMLYHKSIERGLETVRAKIASASNAGKASAKRKLNERSTDVQRASNGRSTDVDIPFNESATDDATETQRASNYLNLNLNSNPISQEDRIRLARVVDNPKSVGELYRAEKQVKSVLNGGKH